MTLVTVGTEVTAPSEAQAQSGREGERGKNRVFEGTRSPPLRQHGCCPDLPRVRAVGGNPF
jgi:hypothetical protein